MFAGKVLKEIPFNPIGMVRTNGDRIISVRPKENAKNEPFGMDVIIQYVEKASGKIKSTGMSTKLIAEKVWQYYTNEPDPSLDFKVA